MARGRIYKRGSTYTFVVDVPPADGTSRKQLSRGGFATKKAAEAELAKVLADVTSGEFVSPSTMTVADFLVDEWLPAAAARIRPTTLRSYRMHVRRHVVPRVGNVKLQRLTAARLNRLYGELRTEVGLADGSVRKIHAILRRALEDAVRWQRIPHNPAAMADPPPQRNGHHDMHTWNPDEVRTFLRSVADDRLAAMWRLFVATGMRRGEVAGLRWIDVDLGAARLEVRQSRVAVGYEIDTGPPKSARSRRSVALDPATVDALRDWREHQRAECDEWGNAWTDTGLVFTREDGTGLHPDRVSKLFDAHIADLDVARIRLHDLRHTHATLALRAGVHPKVVSERLGHSSVSFTLDVYSHAVPALQADAAEQIAGLFTDDSDDEDDGPTAATAPLDPDPNTPASPAHATPDSKEDL